MKKRVVALIIIMLALNACDGSAAETVETPLEVESTEVVEQPTPSPAPEVPAGCSPLPELEPVDLVEVIPQPVTFGPEEGQATFSGTLYGSGPVGIVLSHMGVPGTDQTSWRSFAEVAAARGYMVLTYDLLGFGQSVGAAPTPSPRGNLTFGLETALEFIRSQGAERIIVIGASMGGSASIAVAADNTHDDIIGVGILAASRGQPMFIPGDELSALTMPSLWVSAEGDSVAADMEEMFEAAGSADKELCIYPSILNHATGIFATAYGPDLEHRLLAFIERAVSESE